VRFDYYQVLIDNLLILQTTKRDIRRKIPVQVWQQPKVRGRISSLFSMESRHPTGANEIRAPLLFLTTENQNSLAGFDAVKGEPRLVFQVSPSVPPPAADARRPVMIGLEKKVREVVGLMIGEIGLADVVVVIVFIIIIIILMWFAVSK